MTNGNSQGLIYRSISNTSFDLDGPKGEYGLGVRNLRETRKSDPHAEFLW